MNTKKRTITFEISVELEDWEVAYDLSGQPEPDEEQAWTRLAIDRAIRMLQSHGAEFITEDIEDEPKQYSVGYWMKGRAKQIKTFDTHLEAQQFMLGLSQSDDCESYGIER